MENLGSPRIAQGYQVPVTVGNSQMAPVYAGPDQDSFPSEVTFSSPVSILPVLHSWSILTLQGFKTILMFFIHIKLQNYPKNA